VLRKFDQTGVGYYPNSYFVHMDVREDRGYWVDRSGPGEPADYGRWPPPKQEIDRASAKMVRGALAELEALRHGPNLYRSDEKRLSAATHVKPEPLRERPIRAPALEPAHEEADQL